MRVNGRHANRRHYNGPTRDSAAVGVQATTSIAEASSIYLRYEGNIAGQDSTHALTAGLRVTW